MAAEALLLPQAVARKPIDTDMKTHTSYYDVTTTFDRAYFAGDHSIMSECVYILQRRPMTLILLYYHYITIFCLMHVLSVAMCMKYIVYSYQHDTI